MACALLASSLKRMRREFRQVGRPDGTDNKNSSLQVKNTCKGKSYESCWSGEHQQGMWQVFTAVTRSIVAIYKKLNALDIDQTMIDYWTLSLWYPPFFSS